MRPEELIALLTSLAAAADVLEAIDRPLLQIYRGWDLTCWSYDLVPWGVRFIHHDGAYQKRAVVVALKLPDASEVGDRNGVYVQPNQSGLHSQLPD